jgi:hypothetical protein
MVPTRALLAAVLASVLAAPGGAGGAPGAARERRTSRPTRLSFSAEQGLAAVGQSIPLNVPPGAAPPDVRVVPAADRRWLHAGVARSGEQPVLSVQPVAHRLGPGVYRAVIIVPDAQPARVDVKLFVTGRSATACPPDSTLRYAGGGDGGREPADFGRTFFGRYCVGCHGSAVREPRRSGAPADMNWDSHDAIRRERAWIDAVATHETAPAKEAPVPGMVMPPRGAPARPTLGERHLLAEWIACGAP